MYKYEPSQLGDPDVLISTSANTILDRAKEVWKYLDPNPRIDSESIGIYNHILNCKSIQETKFSDDGDKLWNEFYYLSLGVDWVE